MKTTLFTCLLALCVACAAPRRERLKDVAEVTDVDFKLNDAEKQLVTGSNLFGLRLFQAMVQAHPDSSMVFSPMGVVYSLNMLNNGTDGETLAEICKALGYGEGDLQRVNELNRTFIIAQRKQIKTELEQTRDYMHTANLLAVMGTDAVKTSFKNVLARNYFAETFSALDTDYLQRSISRWIGEQTEGQIKQIPLKLSPNVQVCLVNTIVFRARWAEPFEPEFTKKAPFYCADGRIDSVWMMSGYDRENTFKGMSNNTCSALRMPYKGQFYITMVLPNKGYSVAGLLKSLNVQMFGMIEKGLHDYNEFYVHIPRITLKTSVALKSFLSQVGIKQAFSQQANLCNMSMKPLKLDDVVQQTEFKLDEEGTSAVSGSFMQVATLSACINPTKFHFTANRPFLYYISDGFGNVCFIGQYCGCKR